MKPGLLKEQVIPITLTGVLFIILWALLYVEIQVLNHFQSTDPIQLNLLWADVLVGMTIYLKTSIDFAIFIGHLMRTHVGVRNRVAIECGTAIGNALGTFVILALWNIFREIDWLLAIMVILASLVLFKLAEDGLEHAQDEQGKYPTIFKHAVDGLELILEIINRFTQPLLSILVPHASLNTTTKYKLVGTSYIRRINSIYFRFR